MKLYENIVVGNFLYGLGCAIGGRRKSDTVFSAVSLVQQTPADKLLGDVLLEFAGTIRIIEFKNRYGRHGKEIVKHKQLTATIRNNKNATIISKSVHWFVETKPQGQSFVARIVPYLEAYPRENSQHSLERFIEMTAEDAIRDEALFSHEDLRFYLRLVTACQGSGSIGSGGLILAVRGSGYVKFAELTDMTQLRLQVPEYVRELKMYMERSYAYENRLERERDIERIRGYENRLERERDIERIRGYGL